MIYGQGIKATGMKHLLLPLVLVAPTCEMEAEQFFLQRGGQSILHQARINRKVCDENFAPKLLRLINSFPLCLLGEITNMEMEKREEKWLLEGITSIKDGIVDFKIHLRKVYEAVCSGLMQNREISTYAGYALSKLSCQDSWLDDMDMYIKELLGKVNIIDKYVQKMVNMT